MTTPSRLDQPMGKSFADVHVGLAFVSPAYRIPEDEALEFAGDFDPQPFHTDAEAAKHSLFKGLSVSGWYTAARVFSLILQSRLDIDGGRIGISNGLVCEKPGKPDSALGGQPMPAWMAWNWRLGRCLVWIRPALTARLALVGP